MEKYNLIEKTITIKQITYKIVENFFLKITTENDSITETQIYGKSDDAFLSKICQPCLVKDAFFEIINNNINPFGLEKSVFKDQKYVFLKDELVDYILKNKSLNVNKENLIWVYHQGHVLFDRNGQPIAIPYHYSFDDSPFVDIFCEIDETLNHLKNHPWVLNKNDLIIDQIGHDSFVLNKFKGCKFIKSKSDYVIKIKPDRQVLKQIYEQSIKINKESYPIIMKDLLVSNPNSLYFKNYENDWLNIKQFLKYN